MMAINTIILEGNITRDVDLNEFNNIKLAKTGFAINETVKGEKKTSFFELEVWGNQADYVKEHIHKGVACIVQGRLKINEWTDKLGNIKETKIIDVKQITPFVRRASNMQEAQMPLGKNEPVMIKKKAGELDLGDLDLPF